jgi:NADPH2:quinone reductase
MKAAWYESQGAAAEVLVVGEMPDPVPGQGELRIRVAASGINPGDLKKREDAFGIGMPYPRVIPHSDGAGVIDQVGAGVAHERLGERVWCFGAQSYRAFGTAAQYVLVPADQAIPLPANTDFLTGACLGIPALTAHRAVHVGGPVAGRQVLVQGGAGGVGIFSVGFAARAGARVIATVRSAQDEEAARKAGAHEVLRTDLQTMAELVARIRQLAPDGVQHVVDVAFDANVDMDEQVLAVGGSIAAYATGNARPTLPFWPLLFKNARILLLGSDDFAKADKLAAAQDTNALLAAGWQGLRIDRCFELDHIAAAHRYAESRPRGRVVLGVEPAC